MSVEAINESHALSQAYSQYGKLRQYQIMKIDVLQEPYDLEQAPKHFFPKLQYSDEEILQMIERINMNQGSFEEYKAVKEHFDPIIKGAVNSPTLDLSIDEREEIVDHILIDILKEFSYSFSPDRGRLLSYIKMKVRDRVKVYQERLKYVNASNRKSRRLRSIVLKEHFDELSRPEINLDDDLERAKVISTIQVIPEDAFRKVPRKFKEDLFERIAELGIHNELLRSERQKAIFNLAYGPKRLKQIEIAANLKITQGTVSVNMKRAKENILKKIKK
ncbi:hypothetical protein J53TS2_25950 [Paenibacillus sp. J53TS2]|nr:hypothetical protein J53TS2_25950 [Paenibacillus sp. J53TS2]